MAFFGLFPEVFIDFLHVHVDRSDFSSFSIAIGYCNFIHLSSSVDPSDTRSMMLDASIGFDCAEDRLKHLLLPSNSLTSSTAATMGDSHWNADSQHRLDVSVNADPRLRLDMSMAMSPQRENSISDLSLPDTGLPIRKENMQFCSLFLDGYKNLSMHLTYKRCSCS